MVAKFTRHFAAAVALLAGTTIGHAQGPATQAAYREAVAIYVKTGDLAVAVKPLTGWGKDELEDAVKAVVGRADGRELEPAALLHLEIGIALAGIDPSSAEGHFAFGARLIDTLLPPPEVRRGVFERETLSEGRLNEIATVRATWHSVAGSALLSVNEIDTARPYFKKAQKILPKSAAILTMVGATDEIDGAIYNPDEVEAVSLKNRAAGMRARLLLSAEALYRDALKIDPNYPLAQIRLGRVRFLQNDSKQAGEWLAKGSAAAREPEHRYLAAMFTGALLQRTKDFAGAREAFERALTVAPRSQSAIVGLAYVEMMAGRPDRAQTLVRSHLGTPNADDSWWAFKNGTLDQTGLRWLKAHARK